MWGEVASSRAATAFPAALLSGWTAQPEFQQPQPSHIFLLYPFGMSPKTLTCYSHVLSLTIKPNQQGS